MAATSWVAVPTRTALASTAMAKPPALPPGAPTAASCDRRRGEIPIAARNCRRGDHRRYAHPHRPHRVRPQLSVHRWLGRQPAPSRRPVTRPSALDAAPPYPLGPTGGPRPGDRSAVRALKTWRRGSPESNPDCSCTMTLKRPCRAPPGWRARRARAWPACRYGRRRTAPARRGCRRSRRAARRPCPPRPRP